MEPAINGDEDDFFGESTEFARDDFNEVLLEILSADLFDSRFVRPSVNFDDDLLGDISFLLDDLLPKVCPNFEAVLLTELSFILLLHLFPEFSFSLLELLLSCIFLPLSAFADVLLARLSELPRSLIDLLEELLSKPGLEYPFLTGLEGMDLLPDELPVSTLVTGLTSRLFTLEELRVKLDLLDGWGTDDCFEASVVLAEPSDKLVGLEMEDCLEFEFVVSKLVLADVDVFDGSVNLEICFELLDELSRLVEFDLVS